MKSVIRILLAFSLVMLAACKTKDPVIVTVGDSKLHQSEVYTYAPDWDSWGDRERILFLQRWIDEELVYQQAVKAGALKDSALIRMIERTKRKITHEAQDCRRLFHAVLPRYDDCERCRKN